MTGARLAALILFAVAVGAGTSIDLRRRTMPVPRTDVLVADLHVHPFPGDGVLTPSQIRREAVRRGVDVVGITAHNNQFALRLDRAFGQSGSGVLLIPGQEVTAIPFHVIALGIDRIIDRRLSLSEAIADIQRQGGVAIAAHPIPESWKVFDPAALALLDGAEVAHPVTMTWPEGRAVLDSMVGVLARAKPGLAMIGSTDFHKTAPLGLCRTYLLVHDRNEAGVLDAIRGGRTVAADAEGRLYGRADHVATVASFIASRAAAPVPSALEKWLALAALLALCVLALPARRH